MTKRDKDTNRFRGKHMIKEHTAGGWYPGKFTREVDVVVDELKDSIRLKRTIELFTQKGINGVVPDGLPSDVYDEFVEAHTASLVFKSALMELASKYHVDFHEVARLAENQ